MSVRIGSSGDGGRVPGRFGSSVIDEARRAKRSGNRDPNLAWRGARPPRRLASDGR